MISATKSTLSLNNLKILRPKVKKSLPNFRKKFCEFPPRGQRPIRLGQKPNASAKKNWSRACVRNYFGLASLIGNKIVYYEGQ